MLFLDSTIKRFWKKEEKFLNTRGNKFLKMCFNLVKQFMQHHFSNEEHGDNFITTVNIPTIKTHSGFQNKYETTDH